MKAHPDLAEWIDGVAERLRPEGTVLQIRAVVFTVLFSGKRGRELMLQYKGGRVPQRSKSTF